jgi:insulysin
MKSFYFTPESLDELEKLCVGLFAEVENKNVESPEWKEHPFGPENLQVRGLVVPVKDIRNLNITFPVPDMREHYETQVGYSIIYVQGFQVITNEIQLIAGTLPQPFNRS